MQWPDLPARFPSPATVWRHADCSDEGVRERVWRAVLDELADAGQLDTSEQSLDCTFAPAQKGGRGREHQV